MTWQAWPTDDFKGLARYVVKDVAAQVAQLYIGEVDTMTAHSSGVNGRLHLIRSLYNALQKIEQPIRYVLEPYHANPHQQRIRTPQEVLISPGEGTCLDLSLLFCSLCLAYELIPSLILLDDGESQHALVAVSLTHALSEWDSFNRGALSEKGIVTETAVLLDLISSNKYIAVECTGFAHTKTALGGLEGQMRQGGFISFDNAVAIGLQQIETRPLAAAIDVYTVQRFGYDPYQIEEITTMDINTLATKVIAGLIEHPQAAVLFNQTERILADNPVAQSLLADLKKDSSQLDDMQSLLITRLLQKLKADPALAQTFTPYFQEADGTTIINSGVIAQGEGATAVGERGVIVQGDFKGNIITGDNTKTGGIDAKTIKAETVVHGMHLIGGDLQDAAHAVSLAQALGQGTIKADNIEAKNVVAGFLYIADPAQATTEQLRQEVTHLKRQLAEAIAAGEIDEAGDADDAQTDLAEAEAELAKPEPEGRRVLRKLKSVTDILTESATVAQKAGKVGKAAIKLAPVAAALYQIAVKLFGG